MTHSLPHHHDKIIVISIAEQRLQLREADAVLMDVAVSTAKNGAGEQAGSECTPRGLHQVRAKIGADVPINSVFIGRRPSNEIYSAVLREQQPQRDWILSRILWLSGLEPGRNRLGTVDTMRRYIYIHGCPDEEPMGIANSHGCIRMRNQDVIALFDLVVPGTQVWIGEGPLASFPASC
jgi:lipoprotein-anchoring transpeptidase ErfK/SrfK